MSNDLVEVELKYFFVEKPIATGVMSAELVGKINKAFAIERGVSNTLFQIKVKKSCQAVKTQPERKRSNANRKK
jgi:hypothetical protein